MYAQAFNRKFSSLFNATRFGSKLIGAATLVAAVTLTSSAAFGQASHRWPVRTRPPVFTPTPSWPVEMFFNYHHASTAEEGAQRGRAQVIQAEANYLLNASQAGILNQQARSLALDNDQQWVEDQIARKEWRETESKKRIAEARSHNLAKFQQSEPKAVRLSASRVDGPVSK